jgi:hypothetical protein
MRYSGYAVYAVEDRFVIEGPGVRLNGAMSFGLFFGSAVRTACLRVDERGFFIGDDLRILPDGSAEVVPKTPAP